jgi:hypothetical protein
MKNSIVDKAIEKNPIISNIPDNFEITLAECKRFYGDSYAKKWIFNKKYNYFECNKCPY